MKSNKKPGPTQASSYCKLMENLGKANREVAALTSQLENAVMDMKSANLAIIEQRHELSKYKELANKRLAKLVIGGTTAAMLICSLLFTLAYK